MLRRLSGIGRPPRSALLAAAAVACVTLAAWWHAHFATRSERRHPQIAVRLSPARLEPRPAAACATPSGGINSTPPFVFQVALGAKFKREVPWGVVRADLMALLPPHFEYRMYDDAASEGFLSSYFPEHLELFYDLEWPSHQSDLMRYLLLYKYGGVYVDIDLQPTLPIADILAFPGAPCARSVWFIGFFPGEIANGFIVAQRGDPLFLFLVEGMYADNERVGRTDFGYNVKRLHSVLSELYPGLKPFATVGDTYFGAEVRDASSADRISYTMLLAPNTPAILSNGHTRRETRIGRAPGRAYGQ
jgi:hypothetical protein